MKQKAAAVAEVLPTDSPKRFRAAVERAAALLRAGELVALPTETVYGLAANAFDQRAVARIFEVKGRPAHNPIIVHVASAVMAKACAEDWPPEAERLARAFWPGPLTLVMPRAKCIPDMVTAGGQTVGIRWPNHPFIQAVIQECGFPLAAPSANLSSRTSPTNAAHVFKSLGDKLRLIVDGGQCQVGIESTVVDLSNRPPQLLRPGMVHGSAILGVLGKLAAPGNQHGTLKSPGLLPKHYAPRARLAVWSWTDDRELQRQRQEQAPGIEAGRIHVVAHSHIPSPAGFGRVAVIPHEPEAFARAIYAELHHCDEAGAELIVVEALPREPEWQALADRLRRAAA